MTGFTKEQLLNKGFRYSTKFSPDDEDHYYLRFPVLWYGKIPVLEAEIFLKPFSRKITWTVFVAGTRNIYAGYHNIAYQNDLAPKINEAIERKVRSLGLKDWSVDGKTQRRRKTQAATSQDAAEKRRSHDDHFQGGESKDGSISQSQGEVQCPIGERSPKLLPKRRHRKRRNPQVGKREY